ncbi:hypothetical protein KP509_22G014000 [Ceratopteris richardii]|uniref:Pentatricopeptide repeat-containing protein n=1 Tax=Ceratopteris richardii TaxID=49495 RepID=A0A8T2S4W6_CERRI|nr:hypothetical protein KP509_22G014000 [Ceratopteris richardii]KAH7306463.1 hypothetical protein KP509_22G014000 [Ceratopteris richardii]KAH7306464.1 hypothetical protein KP509_22G014000 [Ceratopteris richardii]
MRVRVYLALGFVFNSVYKSRTRWPAVTKSEFYHSHPKRSFRSRTTGRLDSRHFLPAVKPTEEEQSDIFTQNLTQLFQILAVSSWSFEVEQALQSLSFPITIPLVVQVLRSQCDCRVIFCFFFWLRRLHGFRHNNSTYNNVVHVLIRTRECKFFEQIYFCLQEDRCFLGIITCNALIKAYGTLHKVEEAFNVFSRMNGQVLSKPNILTCNLLLHILVKANEFDWAYEFYYRILDGGLSPDIFTCNIWMLYLCRSQKLKEAYAWLDEIPYPPNFVSYSTLIDGLCKAFKMKEANSIFVKMLDNGISPDVCVFSSLIDGYCKTGMLTEAWRHFKLMDAKGIPANVVTYTCLLDGMLKAGILDCALEILEHMEAAGCAPNAQLCTVRIDALCKQQHMDSANTLLKHMSEVGCTPNIVTYSTLIDGHIKARNVPEAIKLMAEMRASGFAPDSFIYASLLYGFGNACEDAKALVVLEDSLSKSSVLDTRVVNCWLSGLCRADRVDDAYHLFLHLRAEGFLPNTITYNILITGFSKATKVQFAKIFFEGIYNSNCLADLSSYTNLIKGYCKIGAVSHASKLLKEASAEGFIHNFRFHVYTIVNIFETRRAHHAKSFLKLLACCCTFNVEIDKMLFHKLLECEDATAASAVVAHWKSLRRSQQVVVK